MRNSEKQPDGVTLNPARDGKYVAWDATCWDTVAPSRLEAAARKPGVAARIADSTKRDKYKELGQEFLFYPVVSETFGVLSESTKELFSFLGKKTRERSGEMRSTAWLRQRFALAVVRGNIAAVLGTIPRVSRGSKGDDACFVNFTFWF